MASYVVAWLVTVVALVTCMAICRRLKTCSVPALTHAALGYARISFTYSSHMLYLTRLLDSDEVDGGVTANGP
jgi:hypothetical protein